MNSILNGFLIFGVIQAFLFSGLLVSKNKRKTPDLIMTAWLLMFSVHSFLILVYNNNTGNQILQIIPINFTLLYGPFLWLYVNEVVMAVNEVHKRNFLHFIPFVIFFILSLIFYRSGIFLKTLAFLGVISGIIYCFLTYKLLNKYKTHIINHFSNVEKINLNWVDKLLRGLIAIWIGVVIIVFVTRILNMKLPINWFFLVIPFLISYLGYYGLKQQIIGIDSKQQPPGIKSTSLQNNQNLKSKQSYKKSGLQKNEMYSIFELLEELMQTKQLYLQPTLNLKDLAEQSNIPQHHITQTLNEYASVNFYDYINTYRITMFKQKIQQGDAENFSLLGIAFDSGFNSKSSFNRIFKKSTGLSPSEYKNSLS